MENISCPGCGRQTATERVLDDYRYVECGLPNVTLHGGARQSSCSRCHEKFYTVTREGQVMQLIAVTLLTSPNRLHGPELQVPPRGLPVAPASTRQGAPVP